jgi:hypothetical protein
MHPLRNLSARPELIVDDINVRIGDPSSRTAVGKAAPLGRGRVVSALPIAGGPLGGGPHLLRPPEAVRDNGGSQLGDPAGNVIGMGPIRVHRMLTARWTQDTRRIGG